MHTSTPFPHPPDITLSCLWHHNIPWNYVVAHFQRPLVALRPRLFKVNSTHLLRVKAICNVSTNKGDETPVVALIGCNLKSDFTEHIAGCQTRRLRPRASGVSKCHTVLAVLLQSM